MPSDSAGDAGEPLRVLISNSASQLPLLLRVLVFKVTNDLQVAGSTIGD
jgi:hypothetical protein